MAHTSGNGAADTLPGGAGDRHLRRSRDRLPTGTEQRRVPGAPAPVPSLRVPDDRPLPRLVLPVRAARGLRARLHGDQAVGQHHRRAAPRAGAVRLDVRHHDGLRALGQQQAGPGGRAPPQAHRGRRQPGRCRMSASLSTLLRAAETEDIGNPAVNIAIFGVFVAITLVIVFRASRNNKTAADYYAAGRSFTGPQNGTAIAGDYLSAASFLGICGAIAINGYDGFLYSIGFLVAWLVALLLVAELLRNTGKFTMADMLSFRLKQRPVRMAAALATLAVMFFYLLAQMAGAGGLVALLLGVSSTAGQSLVITVVGALMILYVLIGGMKGTTWVQIIKAVLLIAGAGMLTAWVLGSFGLNLSALLGEAAAKSSHGQAVLAPGLQYGKNTTTKLDFVSLGLALVLGTAGLPHILMRFYTVPSAKEARRTVVWAIWLIGIFYL